MRLLRISPFRSLNSNHCITSSTSIKSCIILKRSFSDSTKLKSSHSIYQSLSQQYNGNKYTYNLCKSEEEEYPSSKPIKFNVIDDTQHLQSSLESLNIPTILCKNQRFRKIARHYLPHDFPESVTPNYLPYTLRTNLGSIFGSANAVLATQSLLYALGLGYGSIPLAATLNWILKDFSGQLLAMYLASRISQGFDAYVKKWRFLSCLYYEASIFLEAITPIFNSQIMFLILASIANAGKNICWLSTSASKAHIHKYLCKKENLADITGKAVSQSIASNLIGTSLGMLISIMVTVSNTIHILPIVLSLSMCHILSIYKSLNYIHDPLLNINRCHVLLREYIDYKQKIVDDGMIKLTKPDDMTQNEKILKWKHIMMNTNDNYDDLKYKVYINKKLDECLKSKEDMIEMIDFYENIKTNYWISIDDDINKKNKKQRNKINVWYKKNADNMDILESMLAVGYLQFIHDIDNKGFDLLENAVNFGKKNRNEWINCLKQYQWNIDNLFIELASNRIEY